MTHQSVRSSATAAIILAMTAASPASAGGLTLAHPYLEGGAVDTWARELSNCVDDVAGIYVEVIGGGELGRPRDLADAVADGLVDMAVLPAGALGERWPELAELDQPGRIYDTKQILKLSESPRFVEALNDLGGHGHNLTLLGVGWQHAVLVGSGSGLDDLQGKKLGVRDATTAEALERVGTNAALIPTGELLPALLYGAIDGAIVDAEIARRGIEQAGVGELKWSPDFAPFVAPIVVLMNAGTAEAFGEDISSLVRTECLHVTRDFNAQAIDDMASLVKATEFSKVERDLWRSVFDELRASRLGPDDPVGDVVREALLQ